MGSSNCKVPPKKRTISSSTYSNLNINILRLLERTDTKDNEKSTVLVTGANGFLSGHIISQLLTLGYKVRGTVRDAKDKSKYQHFFTILPAEMHPRLSFVSADLTKEEGWEEAVSGCEYVLHVASPFRYDAKTEDELVVPAVKGTQFVLNACLKHSQTVKKVVVTSSGKAIFEGNYTMNHFNEDIWQNPENAGLYGKSKFYAEKEAWKIYEANQAKLNLTVLNPTLILGPSLSAALSSSQTIISNLIGGKLVPTPVSLGIADVRDVAAAHVLCLQADQLEITRGKRYIICAQTMWIKDVACIYAEYYKKERPELNIFTKEMTHEEFVKKAESVPIFKETLKQSGQYLMMDNTKSLNDIGIAYSSVYNTLIDTANEILKMQAQQKQSQN